jgi:Tol biopolymer transport system component/DNA-binding winged helix-turn-helix (wHTH) protein
MKGKVFQFGPFELDTGKQELRRRGVRVKLPVSRFRLLLMFVTHRDTLITREEIAAFLWSDAQTVDVMSGINTAVNRLRAQLGDDPASPKFIETVIGAGYRFVAGVVEIAAPERLEPEARPEPQTVVQGESSSSQAPPQPAAEITAPNPIRSRVHIVFGVAVALAIAAPILFYALRVAAPSPVLQTANLDMSRVTGSGDVRFANISPDGKYVAYVRETRGRQGIWLKQLATGRLLELASIGEYECPGLAFSSDGSYVYFVRQKPLEPSGELDQVPFLGGTPVKVLDGISGAPAISPDGRKVAFVRSTLKTHGEDSLMTASVDGSGERILVSYKAPGIHMNRVTWTGDGSTLVYPLQAQLMAIPAQGGTARVLTSGQSETWISIDDLRSLPPGNDLIVVGQLSATARPQIFEFSLDGSGIRTITHDLSHYTQVRSTADGKTLVAIQDVVVSTIQTVVPGRESEARSLISENESRDGVEGLAWTPSGDIVYHSESNQRRELIEIGPDGSNPRHLASANMGDAYSDPMVSPRGDFAVATLWFGNDYANIWRFEMTGGDGKRLTAGRQDFSPSITPDGQWVVYGSIVGDRSVLMKVPSQGGTAIRLTDYNADSPSVSPDGKWVACSHIEHPNEPPSLAIVPIAGGPPKKILQLPQTSSLPPLAWTPDGLAVSFINNINGVGNIWRQPVAGGPATPVTHFTSGKIFNFQWSRDGLLVLSRGTETTDAVLIRDFREAGH